MLTHGLKNYTNNFREDSAIPTIRHWIWLKLVEGSQWRGMPCPWPRHGAMPLTLVSV